MIKAKITIGPFSIRDSGRDGFLLIENWMNEEDVVEITEETFIQYLYDLMRREQ